MPVASMLLQFLGLWVFAFMSAVIAAAWFDVSDTLILYGLLLGVSRLVAGRFTRVHERGFSLGEQRGAAAGIAAIALGVHMAFHVLIAQVSTMGATLFPPLALSVTLGFTAWLAPAYWLAALYCVQAADRSHRREGTRRRARAAAAVQSVAAATAPAALPLADAGPASAPTSAASVSASVTTLRAVAPPGETIAK